MDEPFLVIEEYRCACGTQIRLLGKASSGFTAMSFFQHCAQDESRPMLPLLDQLEQQGDFWLSQTGCWELTDRHEHGVARFRELAEAERFRREVLKDPEGAEFAIREQVG